MKKAFIFTLCVVLLCCVFSSCGKREKVENFSQDFGGIWVDMESCAKNGDTVSFSFLSIELDEMFFASYPGGASQVGKIVDVTGEDGSYSIICHYDEEEYMGDYYEEKNVKYEIKISDNKLTFGHSPTIYTYKGESFESAISVVEFEFVENLKNSIFVNTPVTFQSFKENISMAVEQYFNFDASMKLKNLRSIENNYLSCNYGNPYDTALMDAYATNGNISQIECSYANRHSNIEETVKELLIPVTLFFDGADSETITTMIWERLEVVTVPNPNCLEALYYCKIDNIDINIVVKYYSKTDNYYIKVFGDDTSQRPYWSRDFDRFK